MAQGEREREREREREKERERDRESGRQTNRETNRQGKREIQTYIHNHKDILDFKLTYKIKIPHIFYRFMRALFPNPRYRIVHILWLRLVLFEISIFEIRGHLKSFTKGKAFILYI